TTRQTAFLDERRPIVWCGALAGCGTRRESIRGGSVAASMPPHGPATGEGTAPDNWSALI
ncbi:hypothetical protein XaCFBP7622_21140, partial [Xanthomonas arboricola]